ncbi:hypothetical protein B0H14DRAFT_3695152 [Mycena olivaceomarginata]|nr:hypothetical protein B0H14DRAFT_3695152 [Mycena olivaceomarginata]
MSISNTPSPGGTSTLQQGQTATLASKSTSDWLGTSPLMAKTTITVAGECAPFLYIRSVFERFVILLENIEKVKKNREDLKDMCNDTLEIIKIVQAQISAHGDTAAVKFKGLCEDLDRCLQDILDAVKLLQKKPQGLHGRFKEVVKLSSTTKQIIGYQNRIQTLRLNFLMATMDTNFQIHKVTAAPNVPVSQVTQSISNCPPPSRIFQGRQVILGRMHEYFNWDTGKQNIYLLYGLGGAGKT